MKVKLQFYRNGEYNGRCKIISEPGDPKFHTDSTLLYHVKNILNGQGQDLIKKVLSKEGYMVGDNYAPYALIDRKRRFVIFDESYALHDVREMLEKHGEWTLIVADTRADN